MDTVTHALAGTAWGAAIFPATVRRKAAVAGAFLASLPDVDMFFRGIIAHRAETHAFFYLALAVPFFAFFLKRLLAAPFGKALLFTAGALFSHTTLDLMNSYGTACWLPFSDGLFAWDALPIVDLPLAVPLMVATLGALIMPARLSAGRVARAAVIFGVVYCGWGFCANRLAERAFARHFPEISVAAGRKKNLRANPLTGTTFIWRLAAKNSANAFTGYVDVLRGRVFLEQKIPLAHGPRIAAAEKFARQSAGRDFFRRAGDLWIAEETADYADFRDLRYGTLSRPAETLFAVRVTFNGAGRPQKCRKLHYFSWGAAAGAELKALYQAIFFGIYPPGGGRVG